MVEELSKHVTIISYQIICGEKTTYIFNENGISIGDIKIDDFISAQAAENTNIVYVSKNLMK